MFETPARRHAHVEHQWRDADAIDWAALGTRDDRPDYDFTRELTLELCDIADGATLECIVHHPTTSERVRFSCTRRGARAMLRAEGVIGAGPTVSVRGVNTKTAWLDAARELTVELGAPSLPQ